jgi:transcriptional regulator with XRE-family HTH domain
MAKVKKLPILNHLRKYRRACGLKQTQVHRILGLSGRGTLSNWEKGIRLPNAMNLFRLSALYRTLVDALYIDTLRKIREEVQKREVDLRLRKTPAR